VCCEDEFSNKGALGCVRVVVEEEDEKEEGVGEGEELGAVEEELAGPVVGETSKKGGRKEGKEGGDKLEGSENDSVAGNISISGFYKKLFKHQLTNMS